MSQSYLEQDANGFWCPHARVASLIPLSGAADELPAVVNRHPDRKEKYEPCIGALCANWSWENPQQTGPNKEGHCGLSKS